MTPFLSTDWVRFVIPLVLIFSAIPLKAEEDISTLSLKSEKVEPFVLAKAEKLPSLAAGGFAAEPGFSDNFDGAWQPGENWLIASWKQNAAQMAPERCQPNGEGQLVQTVKAGAPFLGGSMQSKREFGWGRWVARVKATAVSGVLNSFFTMDWDNLKTHEEIPSQRNDGKKGEVDIELLSSTFGPGKGEVHLAIHTKAKKGVYQVDVPLDFNPSDDYHDWGFDILPDRVVWHVDGKIIRTWMYTKDYAIDPDYEIFFNSWTDQKWIKGPPAQDAKYHIDWVKFYPLQKP